MYVLDHSGKVRYAVAAQRDRLITPSGRWSIRHCTAALVCDRYLMQVS
jgi:hypothetical protein